MKKFKVKLSVSRSGVDGSHAAGDTIEVLENEFIALIQSNQASPINKKEYEAVIAKIDQVKTEEAEKEAQATAILKKEILTGELRDLYAQVACKAAQIDGVVLTDEEVEAFVEKSMNGEDPGDEENKDGANNTTDTKSSSDQVSPKGDGK